MIPNAPFVSPVLIGRAQEIETLTQALHMVQKGTGQCFVIAGDAGVGKSRLLHEVCHQARSGHFLLLQGSCFEQDTSFPYASLVDALRTHFAHRTPDEIRKALGPLASEIVKLVPELALILPDLQPTPPLDAEAEKRRLFEALIRFFIQLAATQPLLILLEDLHWSDQTSLDFLQLFVRRLATYPILLLTSYRLQEAPLHLTHLLAHFDRERFAREIVLAPLTPADVDVMLDTILDLPIPLRAELVALLYPLTEGNPFWIEEVLKSLIAAEEIIYREGRWERRPTQELHIPRSVQNAVQRRIEQLDEVERRVLTLAAVAGRRFNFVLLREATHIHEQELLRIFRQLIAKQLVVEESADQYAFRHALTREAIYAMLLRRERKALHQHIAEILEELYAGAPDAHVADLAYHYEAAEVWSKVARYAQLAGKQAEALYAPYEAIEHFTRVLTAAEQMAMSPPTDILCARGRAYHTVGKFEAARRDYEASLHMVHAAGDGMAEWHVLIDLGFLWSSSDYTRTGEYFQRALELARTLGDPATLAHSLNRLGNWYANVEQPVGSLRYHHEALAIFQTLDNRRGVLETLDLLGMASQLSSNLVQAHASFQSAIDLGRELADRWSLISSLACLPLCAASYIHNIDVPATTLLEARNAAEEAIELAREMDWRAGETFARLNLAMCLGPLGEYREALEMAHTALLCAEDIEHHQWMAGAHTVLGVLYLDLLAYDAARLHLERARVLAETIGSLVWTSCAVSFLAMTCAAQGETRRAESLLQAVLTPETPMHTQFQRSYWYAAGEVALACGDAQRALQISTHLIAAASNMTATTVIPPLWKLQGEALAVLGDLAAAESILLAARAAAFEQGSQSVLWRTLVALAKLYQAAARRDEAQAAYDAARALIHALGAHVPDEETQRVLIERATALLPRLPAPSAARAAKQKFGGLTAREREVAALIAQGHTNREIAEILVVGVRTVEAHITRMLVKLDFTSRTQIATWAIAQGLPFPKV